MAHQLTVAIFERPVSGPPHHCRIYDYGYVILQVEELTYQVKS